MHKYYLLQHRITKNIYYVIKYIIRSHNSLDDTLGCLDNINEKSINWASKVVELDNAVCGRLCKSNHVAIKVVVL